MYRNVLYRKQNLLYCHQLIFLPTHLHRPTNLQKTQYLTLGHRLVKKFRHTTNWWCEKNSKSIVSVWWYTWWYTCKCCIRGWIYIIQWKVKNLTITCVIFTTLDILSYCKWTEEKYNMLCVKMRSENTSFLNKSW